MGIGRRRRDRDTSVAPDALPAGADPVLGTLRSELDDDVTLPATFTRVQEETTAIRDAVVAGELPRDDAAEQLSALRIAAPDGTLWAAGASSLTWYRKLPGGSWARHVPPLGDEATDYRLCDPVQPVAPPEPSAPSGGPADAAVGPLSLDDLAALARDLDGDHDELAGLDALPELADDIDRPDGPPQQPLDLPPLVPPGATVADTDDALGDDGRLDDDELAALSGQGTTDDSDTADDDLLEQLRRLGALDEDLPAPTSGPGDPDWTVDEDDEGLYGTHTPGQLPDWAVGDDEDDEDDFGYGA